jgi:hypothetical protein
LQNTSIEGNLIIDKAVGEGNATFKNVVVKGDTYVYGGGTNSVYFIDTHINSFEANAAVKITGAGTVDKATINASGVTYDTKFTSQTVAPGVSAPVKTPSTGGGGGGSGSGSGSSTVYVTGIAVTGSANVSTVVNGGTLGMSATVTPNNAANQTIAWSVASLVGGTANINSTTGLLTATGVGTVRVTATNVASGVTGTEDITVTAATLTIAAPTLTLTKAYDGTTTAAVTAGALSGVIGSDVVTVSAAATYDAATVGKNKTITVAYTLGGANAGNYVKPVNYTVTTGVITAAGDVLAVGSAGAKEGDHAITYTLTGGTFDSAAGILKDNWTLGGTNAADLGSISDVELSSGNTVATITVSGTVGVDTMKYTVKPAQTALAAGKISGIATTVYVHGTLPNDILAGGTITAGTPFGSGAVTILFTDATTHNADKLNIYGLDDDVLTYTSGFAGNVGGGSEAVGDNYGTSKTITITFTDDGTGITSGLITFTLQGAGGGALK